MYDGMYDGMYYVAATRWAAPPDQELLGILTPLLGVGLYDLRLRLAGPLPVIVARQPEPALAQRLLAVLREHGHGAVAGAEAQVRRSEALFTPRNFTLEPGGLETRDGDARQRIAYGEILALIRATSTTVEVATETTHKRKLSLGRAMVTGGLVPTKKVSKESRQETEQREQVLYVVHQTPEASLYLRESRLRYTGLGPKMSATTGENFNTLVAGLRALAPGAFFDDRLAHQRRAESRLIVQGGASSRSVSTSNASENDLAAFVLVQAFVQKQL